MAGTFRFLKWPLVMVLASGCAADGFREINPKPPNLKMEAGLVIYNSGQQPVIVGLEERTCRYTILTSVVPPGVPMFFTVPAGEYSARHYPVNTDKDAAPSKVVYMVENKCYEWQIGH